MLLYSAPTPSNPDTHMPFSGRKTRDGMQRFAIPRPYGSCVFVNDASYEELYDALDVHKALIKEKYGSGDGIEVISLFSNMIHHNTYHIVSSGAR